jgi:hypothetical protein
MLLSALYYCGTLVIVAVNGANQLNIALRTLPGSYRVARQQAAEQFTSPRRAHRTGRGSSLRGRNNRR